MEIGYIPTSSRCYRHRIVLPFMCAAAQAVYSECVYASKKSTQIPCLHNTIYYKSFRQLIAFGSFVEVKFPSLSFFHCCSCCCCCFCRCSCSFHHSFLARLRVVGACSSCSIFSRICRCSLVVGVAPSAAVAMTTRLSVSL